MEADDLSEGELNDEDWDEEDLKLINQAREKQESIQRDAHRQAGADDEEIQKSLAKKLTINDVKSPEVSDSELKNLLKQFPLKKDYVEGCVKIFEGCTLSEYFDKF